MNPKTRQRAMRSFLASLLQSELSIAEIEEIADELYFGTFGKEVGDFMRNALNTLTVTDKDKLKSSREETLVKSINETILRRRLPKKAILQLITLAAPRIKSTQFSLNSTVPELLEKFMDIANPSEVKSLVSILEGEPADAYLKGIAKRNREK
ncbi:hypothetical protein JQ612_34270 [Bradyrhizobium manausense]|uniref:hypothetical protein n=1 Tax=Bradyrhizobium manausense TaxID=989370 RepID=UPI001BAC2C47|nr:hypothetical protein [Bradyrhizobium manausense]MBR0838292.1 hypothetical protein [Bradyrhizobium manausense]